MRDFTYIADKADKTYTTWTNSEKVKFHYFNKNGFYAQWRDMCQTIKQYVDAGIIPSGWHLAYGSLSSYAADQLIDLHGKNRIGKSKLSVTLKMLKSDIDKGYSNLAEHIQG